MVASLKVDQKIDVAKTDRRNWTTADGENRGYKKADLAMDDQKIYILWWKTCLTNYWAMADK